MIGIFMLALCVGAGVANKQDSSKSTMYSCPPESMDVRAFRDMADVERSPAEIPSLAQAERDLDNETEDMQSSDINRNDLSRALFTSHIEFPYYSFVRWCCPAPTFECTSVDIPMWYIHYGSHGFCFVIHPYGNKVIQRKKCTCVKCLYRNMYCPTMGRCVEAWYYWYHAIIYCPWSWTGRRFYRIMLLVPTRCYCRPYCPWFHYGAADKIDSSDGR